MLSYLSNRHYQLLTKELPEELKNDQPKVIYLPSHSVPHALPSEEGKRNSKLRLKRSKQMQDNSCPGDCCPICFTIDNISVEYYGRKHVCVKCRKLVRDEFGNQIRIFVNEMGDIVCLGIKAVPKGDCQPKIFYYTDYTALQINGRSAFATFAEPDQMVLILRTPAA